MVKWAFPSLVGNCNPNPLTRDFQSHIKNPHTTRIEDPTLNDRDYKSRSAVIFSPVQNDPYLWKKGETEKQFRAMLTEQGNLHFKKVHLELVLDKLQSIITDLKDQEWLTALENKYRI